VVDEPTQKTDRRGTDDDGADEERLADVMEAFHKRLQEEGLKSTKQRDLIVERFFRLDKHITADELLEEVREEQPRIGYATVYRTLKLLVEQNFALTKDFGDGQTRYDQIHKQDPQHDHLICVDCRKIVEFTDQTVDDRLTELTEEMDYAIRRKELELYVECNIDDCPNRPEPEE
jgi:Fur family ferric uptake transcriptional regulator